MESISIAEYKKKYALKVKRKSKRSNSLKKERVVSDGEATLIQHLRAYGIEFKQEYQLYENQLSIFDSH